MKVGVIYSSIFLWEMLISYKSNVKEICIERAVQVMTWRQPLFNEGISIEHFFQRRHQRISLKNEQDPYVDGRYILIRQKK